MEGMKDIGQAAFVSLLLVRFEAKLQRRIYLDFYSVYDNTADLSFESIYNMWQKRCDYYKWEFPELFAKVKTYDDFRQFLHEYSDVM